MNYQTFEPCKALSAFVKCYWTLDGPEEATPQKQRIIPDGCMEMIFHYGDLYRQYKDDGCSVVQPRCCVFGQLTAPLEIEPAGKTGIFSVRFQPEGFTPFAALPVKDFENKAVALEKVYGAEGLKLEDDVLNAAQIPHKIGIVERFLLDKLGERETIDRVVQSAVDTLLGVNGQLSIGELSRQMQINRKQLERKFSSVIGLSPKQLSRIIRLQATLKRLADGRFTSLTALAYEGEYYDQAHFIKDFKEFTGTSPRHFYSDNLRMSSLFYGIAE